jgi:hypothetical protein
VNMLVRVTPGQWGAGGWVTFVLVVVAFVAGELKQRDVNLTATIAGKVKSVVTFVAHISVKFERRKE